tara:strand:+ start:395 stop:862 length:468 start_codon:yes stop_codon:yes gene_type:complete
MNLADIENADAIIAIHKSGATNLEIGAELGLTMKQVRNRLQCLGLMRTQTKLTWNAELEKMWSSGVTRDEIAKRLGCDPTSISRMARRLGKPKRLVRGIPRRPVSNANMTDLTPEQVQDIATLRNFGDTLEVAVGKVTAPKVKIRATPKQSEARA